MLMVISIRDDEVGGVNLRKKTIHEPYIGCLRS
jgi:hypothetical protein